MGDQINHIDDAAMLVGSNVPPLVQVEDDSPAPPLPNGPMHWAPVQPGFMLRRFHDLVVQGLKTDKGFKEVHVRQVATMLSEFATVNVST
jgi:hypothetical protein